MSQERLKLTAVKKDAARVLQCTVFDDDSLKKKKKMKKRKCANERQLEKEKKKP